jgi:hypothetical protein
MNFPAIWKSGYVTRYHANPNVPAETLAEHHGRVAQIIFAALHLLATRGLVSAKSRHGVSVWHVTDAGKRVPV